MLARTGKVYFQMGGAGYVCSGAVAVGGAEGLSLVLTAGHCVYDHVNGFATYWLFIPAFDANPDLSTAGCSAKRTKYGCWTAQGLVAHSGFTSEPGFTTRATIRDFAFAVVGPGGKSGTAELDKLVGAYPLALDVADRSRLSAFGYPAAAPYNGRDLTYCSGSVDRDVFNALDSNPDTAFDGPEDPWRMTCGMTGGSSGGPWLVTEPQPDAISDTMDASGNGGELGSLNSYGYDGYPYMFGPVFNNTTLTVYEAAKVRATGNLVVP